MTDTNDSTKRDELVAQVREAGEKLKDEIARRLDQFLDELGAKIGSQQ